MRDIVGNPPLRTKEAFALVALAELGGKATSPKNVGQCMMDLGFETSSSSWRAAMGKTLHGLGVGEGRWASGDRTDPENPKKWDGTPAYTVYNADRNDGGWAPFRLTKAGEAWVEANRAEVLALGRALPTPNLKASDCTVCLECRALVALPDEHKRFHEALADAIEAGALARAHLPKERLMPARRAPA